MAEPHTRGRAVRAWVGTAVGASAGFLVGAGLYELIAPALEASQGWLRETQGLVWNLAPLLAVVGGILGYRIARRAR
ncbi:hypothetical protein [Demequina sp. SO4-18]|uniref:hypothetical protein n=1 Tax=Demequina sp. SO4-18 TaxID=3401026 RepID=UPI003B5CB5E2